VETRSATETLVATITAKDRESTQSGLYFPELQAGQRAALLKDFRNLPRKLMAGLLFDEMIDGKENAEDAWPKPIRTALVKALAQCMNRVSIPDMVSAFSGWRRCPVLPGAVFGALKNSEKRQVAGQSAKTAQRRKLAAGAQGRQAAQMIPGLWGDDS